MNKYIVAIDGFAGTGKGTIAKLLGDKLEIMCIDSGAIYRAGGYYAWENNIDLTEEEIRKMIEKISMKLKFIEGIQHIYINNVDYTPYIRSKEANEYSSKIAVIGIYRNKVNEILRETSNENSVIMEGRDIATVVFPNADVKFFFEASVEVRVKRRILEYKEKGQEISEETIRNNIIERDIRDTTRQIDPMHKTKESIVIDTSDKTIEEVVNITYNIIKEKVGI